LVLEIQLPMEYDPYLPVANYNYTVHLRLHLRLTFFTRKRIQAESGCTIE